MRGFLVAIFLVGCATPRAARMRFEDAARSEPSSAPLAAPSLDASLERFLEASRKPRLETPIGGAMPPSQVKAWTALLDDAERFAHRKPTAAWTTDAMRARLQLEAEFQTDGRLYGDIPPSVSERVPRTLSLISQRILARSPVKSRRANPRAFTWPVTPLVVSSPFGTRVHPIAGELRFHAGIDLEVPMENPVRAAEDGVVVFSAWNGGHGKQVELQHDAHWATRYSHLDKLLVKSGATVHKGQLIGLSGQTGAATGPHLHFELRRDGDALDPETFLEQPGTAAPLVSVGP